MSLRDMKQLSWESFHIIKVELYENMKISKL